MFSFDDRNKDLIVLPHLREIYKLEATSNIHEIEDYLLNLKNKDKEEYDLVCNRKKEIESLIPNVKQVLLYHEESYGRTQRNLFFEEFKEENNKVLIYLKKIGEKYIPSERCISPFCLEQIFDENNQIISETIKENPYYMK
ncbi:MAG: hypothetical protein K8V75_02185 [Methanobrevibacter woesei]|nr:hypothetical protein [Methanobrevibacter woesei]